MQLSKKVRLERRAHTQDGAGQNQEVWGLLAEVWASVRPVRGREFYAASGQRAEITHEIVIRHYPDLSPKDRVVMGARIFAIQSVINAQECNRYTNIMGVEHVH